MILAEMIDKGEAFTYAVFAVVAAVFLVIVIAACGGPGDGTPGSS